MFNILYLGLMIFLGVQLSSFLYIGARDTAQRKYIQEQHEKDLAAGRQPRDLYTGRKVDVEKVIRASPRELQESFMIELIKKGKITDKNILKKYKQYSPKTKTCVFCSTDNGIAETTCSNCKRPLDRETIEKEVKVRDEKILKMEEQMAQIVSQMASLDDIKKELKKRKSEA